MKVTLEIDPEVLDLARKLAASEQADLGVVLSRLAREGYAQRAASAPRDDAAGTSAGGQVRNGVPMLPSRGERVTPSHVEALRDEESF